MRKQFAAITIALLAGTILICWFINITFLESYYQKDKEKVIEGAFHKMNQASIDNQLETDEFRADRKSVV